MGLESYVGQMSTQGGMSTLLEMQLGAMSGAAGTIHSGMFAASAGTAGMSSFGVVALGGTGGAVGTIGGAKGLFVFALGAAVVLAQTGSLVAILRSPNQQDSGGEEFHGPQSFRWVSGTSRPTSGGPYKGFFNPTTGEMILSTVSHHSQERRISDIDNFIGLQVWMQNGRIVDISTITGWRPISSDSGAARLKNWLEANGLSHLKYKVGK
jgi:hypothetical protein